MIEINNFYDKYNNIIGFMFCYSEQKVKNDGENCLQFSKICVCNGEIVIAETLDSYRHNIQDYDCPHWDSVGLALKVFLEKAPKEFDIIVSQIKKGNMSYAIAERVILDEIDRLEEYAKSLKMMIKR